MRKHLAVNGPSSQVWIWKGGGAEAAAGRDPLLRAGGGNILVSYKKLHRGAGWDTSVWELKRCSKDEADILRV